MVAALVCECHAACRLVTNGAWQEHAVALLGGAVSMIIRVAGTMGVADGGGAPATHAQPSNPDGIAVIAGGGFLVAGTVWSPCRVCP